MTATALLVPDHRRAVARLEAVGPGWFASVMGTGVIAIAVAGLPVVVPGAAVVATVAWLLAALLLVGVLAVTAGQWRHHPRTARGHLADPVRAHGYGTPPMALMTVGVGAPLAGRPVLGDGAALDVAVALWCVGTVGGLVTMVLVPWCSVRVHRAAALDASPVWLLPVVPPMVSAATGALLVPHTRGPARDVLLLLLCHACFVVAVGAVVAVLVLLVLRLRWRGLGPVESLPTWWIVLGPLGQTVTAAHHLGVVAPDGPFGGGRAVLIGVPVLVVALVWLVVVVSLTARAARILRFSQAWWAFTFPVGTLVTGSAGLADQLDDPAVAGISVGLCALLVVAWCVVAGRVVRFSRS